MFEAAGYVDRNGNPLSAADMLRYLDSSDYLVSGLQFTTRGERWKLSPVAGNANLTRVEKFVNNTWVTVSEMPIGFSFDAVLGKVVVSDMSGHVANAGWGVEGFTGSPGPLESGEIQHSPAMGSSEQLIIGFGEHITEVQATLGWLMRDSAWVTDTAGNQAPNGLLERSRVTFLQTRDAGPGAVALGAQQASVTATVQDATRIYMGIPIPPSRRRRPPTAQHKPRAAWTSSWTDSSAAAVSPRPPPPPWPLRGRTWGSTPSAAT